MSYQFVCLGCLLRTTWALGGGGLFCWNMANRLDRNSVQNNESQPGRGFHSQAVHSCPDKGILYTAPTQIRWTPSTVAQPGPTACVHRLEKDQKLKEQASQELESPTHRSAEVIRAVNKCCAIWTQWEPSLIYHCLAVICKRLWLMWGLVL